MPLQPVSSFLTAGNFHLFFSGRSPCSRRAEFLFPPFVLRHTRSRSAPWTKILTPRWASLPTSILPFSARVPRLAPEVPGLEMSPGFGGLCQPTGVVPHLEHPPRCCDLYGPTRSDTPTRKSRSLPRLPLSSLLTWCYRTPRHQ